MGITVRLMSYISSEKGKNILEIPPGPRTVGELIKLICSKDQILKDELLDEDGSLDYIYHVSLNGKVVKRVELDSTEVRDGDEVVIYAVLGGG